MINELNKKDTLDNIYRDLESGVPENKSIKEYALPNACLLYTSPSPRDDPLSRMPSSA